MDADRFSLGPTATYRERTCVWIGGGLGGCDGFCVLSVYPQSGMPPPPKTYAVTWTDDGVIFWEINGDRRQRPVVVTATRCSCEGMWQDRGDCKHASAVKVLVERGYLPAPPFTERDEHGNQNRRAGGGGAEDGVRGDVPRVRGQDGSGRERPDPTTSHSW